MSVRDVREMILLTEEDSLMLIMIKLIMIMMMIILIIMIIRCLWREEGREIEK